MTATARIWFQVVTGAIFLVIALFVPAGRLDYWQGWVYLGLSLVVLLVSTYVLRDDPGLIAERLYPGKGMKAWDKVYFAVSSPLYVVAIFLAGLDAGRGHWTGELPAGVYAFGILIFVLGQALFLWAKRRNSYFSSVVRIQMDRGQKVCRAGPYRYVRHPGYLAGILFGLATPLVLGSAWALIPQALAALLLVGRTALEDRTLKEELPGYEEYARSVTCLLVPRVW
jgi:protein-S-isoprenylcysteine O-methyltransferase Ste14